MNPANFINSFRIVLGLVFIYCFLAKSPAFKVAALVVIAICEISHIMDGYLARKYPTTNTVGRLLAPLADSIFLFSVFLAFLVAGYAQIWMVAIIFYHDSAISWIRTIAVSRNQIIGIRLSGKANVWSQRIVAMTIVTLATGNCWWPVPHLKAISFWLLTITMIFTAASGIDYFVANLDCLRKIDHKPCKEVGLKEA